MYEFLVLAQLSRRPMHGYLIAKIIGNMIGPIRHVQWGALYPVLSRLEQEGLICADEQVKDVESRARKSFAITEKGRERLHDLMMDTNHHRGEYDALFSHKVAFFWYLNAEERLHLSRDYAVYAQQHLDHINLKCRDISEQAPWIQQDQKECVLTVMDHRRAYWQNELQWAKELIENQRKKEAM